MIASLSEMRPDAPDWIIRGVSSSRRRRNPGWFIQRQVAAWRRGLAHPGLNAWRSKSTYTEHSIPPRPSRGTFSGSLLGHSLKREENAVYSCPNTGGSLGPPTLQNQRQKSHTQQYARARYGGDIRKRDPQPGIAREEHQKGLLPGMARSEQRRQGWLHHRRCTHTGHTSPPSPSRATCSGVPAGPDPLRGAVFSCYFTGRLIGP